MNGVVYAVRAEQEKPTQFCTEVTEEKGQQEDS
jgi:hypothetical protein